MLQLGGSQGIEQGTIAFCFRQVIRDAVLAADQADVVDFASTVGLSRSKDVEYETAFCGDFVRHEDIERTIPVCKHETGQNLTGY